MNSREIISAVALLLQVAVAVYALWLNRIFGTRRAAWVLCLAFLLMFSMHLNEAVSPPVTVAALGLQPELAYAFISLLLLLGLSHLGSVFRERQKSEELVRQARDVLELRVQERTAELQRSNEQLLQEVQQRKDAEAKVRASQELYRGLVDSLDAVMFECDRQDLRFTFVSAQAERLLGYTTEQWLREVTWRDLLHPEDYDRFLASRGAIVGERPGAWLEYRVRTRDQRVRRVRHIAALADGNEQHVRGVLLDVTERRQLEDEMRQMQKMEAIGRLAGGVAHDFNNILTVIQGYSQLLLSSDGLPEEPLDHVRQISQATDRASQLTQQLLAFSRKRDIKTAPVDVNSVVRNLAKMLTVLVGETISVQLVMKESLPPVEGDAGALDQVLMNLAANARDAMPSGGRLLIQTDVVSVDGASVEGIPGARGGTFVCLTVTDTGTGIDPQALPHIFEPFFTTKAVGKGTGLGLSTVYGIVKQHQGWMRVSSQSQVGTTFRVFLPATQAEPKSTPTPGMTSVPSGHNATMLVVEDEPALLELVTSILEGQGYRVLPARSGPAALDLWREHSRQVDLLLTDVVMPDGISGPDLVQRVRQDRPEIRAILMSGYAATEFPLSDRDLFLQKPYRPSTLLKAIHDSFTSPEQTQAA